MQWIQDWGLVLPLCYQLGRGMLLQLLLLVLSQVIQPAKGFVHGSVNVALTYDFPLRPGPGPGPVLTTSFQHSGCFVSPALRQK